MTFNKKTIQKLSINQNNIIRYLTGLSRNSHISNLKKIKIIQFERYVLLHEIGIYQKLI